MKKPLNLNNQIVDVDKISFIGKVDTIIKAHINATIHFFNIVVEGNEVSIVAENKDDADKLRTILIHECGASTPQKFTGLMPS